MQSEDEREMCARTVYCTNIDKKVLSSPCPGWMIKLNGFLPHLMHLSVSYDAHQIMVSCLDVY